MNWIMSLWAFFSMDIPPAITLKEVGEIKAKRNRYFVVWDERLE